MVNRRPVAFKDALRSCSGEEIPTPITPEPICRGYELLSVNIIPELQPYHEPDLEWIYPNPTTKIKSNLLKLNKVLHQLIHTYHSEFLTTLVKQATDEKMRYK